MIRRQLTDRARCFPLNFSETENICIRAHVYVVKRSDMDKKNKCYVAPVGKKTHFTLMSFETKIKLVNCNSVNV
jgi:hypothetical protein